MLLFTTTVPPLQPNSLIKLATINNFNQNYLLRKLQLCFCCWDYWVALICCIFIGWSHEWVMSVSLRVFVNIELLLGKCNDLAYRSCQIIKLPNRLSTLSSRLKTRHYFCGVGLSKKRWKIFDRKEMTKQDVTKKKDFVVFSSKDLNVILNHWKSVFPTSCQITRNPLPLL